MPSFILLSAFLTIIADASPMVHPITVQPMNITRSRVQLDGRIVGGKEVAIEDYPYQLSLEFMQEHICGASILSATRALTAAKCTYTTDKNSLSVRAGSSRLQEDGQVVFVVAVKIHPDYNAKTHDYDVSVLFLRPRIYLGSDAKALSLLARGSKLDDKTTATVSGWGRVSRLLEVVDVYKVNYKICKCAYQIGCCSTRITPRMTCYGDTVVGCKGPTKGDAGGPLVIKRDNGIDFEILQIGIISWSETYGSSEYPDVYTNIAHNDINDFITDYLK